MLNLLNRELHLYRSTFVPNSTGGLVETKTFQRSIQVRVSQPSGTEIALARSQVGPQQGGTDLRYKVFTASDETVKRNDELHDPETGEVFRVVDVVAPSSDGFYKRMDCERRQPQEDQ